VKAPNAMLPMIKNHFITKGCQIVKAAANPSSESGPTLPMTLG
jgi:hypothetical protein